MENRLSRNEDREQGSVFHPERLTEIRRSLGITMAEAARRLNLSKMGYSRYEHGDRTPSYQTIEFMAQRFGTSYEYLTGATDDPSPETIIISKKDNLELYELIKECQKNSTDMPKRLLAYLNNLNNRKDSL